MVTECVLSRFNWKQIMHDFFINENLRVSDFVKNLLKNLDKKKKLKDNIQFAGRLRGRPLRSTDEKRVELTAALLFRLVISHAESFVSLLFFFFQRSLWLSVKAWVTVQSGRCSLLHNFGAAGSLQQLLMKTTIHSQKNNCFQGITQQVSYVFWKMENVEKMWEQLSVTLQADIWFVNWIWLDDCMCCIAALQGAVFVIIWYKAATHLSSLHVPLWPFQNRLDKQKNEKSFGELKKACFWLIPGKLHDFNQQVWATQEVN